MSKSDLDLNPSDGDAEAAMRRALGLDRSGSGSAAAQGRPVPQSRPGNGFGSDRPKRAFAQDGSVDVVFVHGRRDHSGRGGERQAASGFTQPANRADIAQSALQAERDARERAERSLAELEVAVRDLRTRLGHATLAVEEAREQLHHERQLREAAELALAEQRLASPRPHAAPQAQMIEPPHAAASQPKRSAEEAAKTRKPAAPRRRAAEPKPVKWWLASKKAK